MKVVGCVFLSNFPLHNHHSSCTGSQLLFPLSHNTICNIQTKSTKIVTNQTNRTNSIIFHIFSILTLEQLYDVSFVIHYNMNEKIKNNNAISETHFLESQHSQSTDCLLSETTADFHVNSFKFPQIDLNAKYIQFRIRVICEQKLFIRSPNFRHGIWIDLCRVWLSINYVFVWAIGSNRRNE